MKSKLEIFIWIVLISISTAFSFAIGSGDRNLLLIGVMSLLPFVLIFNYPYFKKNELWIYLLFVSMFFCGWRHHETFRISTLIYSLMFILTFILCLRIVYSEMLDIDRYLSIIKVIITAYFITLVIQQLCVLMDLPYVFNQIHTWEEGAYKLNALAPEPSHTSRILTLLMYTYITIREIKLGRDYDLKRDVKKDLGIWFLFLYPMLTMRSGAAFIVLPILLLKFIKLRNLKYLVPPVLLVVFTLSNLNITAVNRAVSFSQAVITLDVSNIISADHSASFRVVPSILYFQMFNLADLNTWLGYGIDYDVILFPSIIPGLPEGSGAGGIFPTFIMNFGLISGLILFFILKKHCFRKLWSFDTLLWLVMIGPVPLNTQLVWLSLILLAINKYFLNHYTFQKDHINNEIISPLIIEKE